MGGSISSAPSIAPIRVRSIPSATAPPAAGSAGPTSGTFSSPTKYSGCAYSPCTMYISCCRSLAPRGSRSVTVILIPGPVTGSPAIAARRHSQSDNYAYFRPGSRYMSSNPILGSIFMYGAIFAIFYFILIRPQSTQRKKHDEMVRNLKKGDEIVTTGGVVGEVLFIKEKGGDDKSGGMDDRVTIKSGDTRLIIERGRIAKINRPTAASNVTAG